MDLSTMIGLGIIIWPGPVFTIMNIRNIIQKEKYTGMFETVAFSLGIFYSLILYYFFWVPLRHVSEEHILAIMVSSVVGLISYIYLKTKIEEAPFQATVFSMAGIFIGILVNSLVIFQLLEGSRKEYETFTIMFPGDILLMMLVPFNYILLAVDILIKAVRKQSIRNREATDPIEKEGKQRNRERTEI